MNRIMTAVCAVCLLCSGIGVAQTAQTTTEPSDMKSEMNTVAEIPAGPVVEVSTTLGPIKVKLYDDTPLHRDNFLKLIESNFYDGVLFHRVIKDFMVQTGDPKSKDAAPGAMLGAGDPGYTIPAEIRYPEHYHKYGALAAARTGDQVNPERRSSGSQFYIVTGRKYPRRQVESMVARALNGPREQEWNQLQLENRDTIIALRRAHDQEGLEALRQQLIKQLDEKMPEPEIPAAMLADYERLGGTPHLDGEYTVFGEVLEGMDVVEHIQNVATDSSDRPVEDIKILGIKVLEP